MNHRAAAALAAVLVLTALVVLPSVVAFRQIAAAAEARKQSFGTIMRADALLSALRDAETGQRGYSITGDESFLEPYLAVRDGIPGKLAALRERPMAPASRAHLDALAPLVTARLAEMARVVAMRRSQDMGGVKSAVSSGRGNRLMNAIRAEVAGFVELEQSALEKHDADFQSDMRFMLATIVVACITTLVFALLFAYLVYRQTQQRLEARTHSETKRILTIQQETNLGLALANSALVKSEESLAVTLRSIGDAVIATDTEARVTRLNPTAERLTGWTLAEATGRPVGDVFTVVSKLTRHPATIPIMESLAHGTVQGLANHTVLIARNGRECDIADSCAPIRDPSGAVVGAVLVFRDVTEEYALQQAVRDSGMLTQTILNTVADGIITLRAEGHIIETANPAAVAMFGYTAAEIVGKSLACLVPEIAQAALPGTLPDGRESRDARAHVLDRALVGHHKDGTTFPVEIALGQMSIGGIHYFTGILRDISERQLARHTLEQSKLEAEQSKLEAERANREKSDFLARMSHELRSPLNAILGFAQLMESDTPAPTPSQLQSLTHILKAGWHLLALINEVLDLAVIESGKVSLSTEPVSLDEVCAECAAMLDTEAQQRGVTLTLPRFERALYVSADRTRLKQVLINLLSNAIKYNRQQGTVQVEVAEVERADIPVAAPGGTKNLQRTRISVTDSGVGMSKENLVQLFQPFNRLGQEAAGGVAGTGIGLVVTERLVKLMGGSIAVTSKPGVGTVFSVELLSIAAPQLAFGSPDVAAEGVEPEPRSQEGPRHTLLYVEDNPANMKLVEQLIARRPDMQLLTAVNGVLGLELARRAQPTLILMDINLPGISGVATMRLLREDPSTAHIPVVALSANASPRDIELGLEHGFFRYLTKPINIKEFMDTLNLVLQM